MFLIGARAELRVGLGRVVICDGSSPIAFAVAISVLAEPEHWRFGDERAAAGERQRARHHQTVEKHRPLVHPAVAVGVFEHGDASHFFKLAVAFEVGHVAAHFEHPQPALGIECDLNWIMNQRLGGDQFDAASRLNFE